jgi:hypothetical protein
MAQAGIPAPSASPEVIAGEEHPALVAARAQLMAHLDQAAAAEHAPRNRTREHVLMGAVGVLAAALLYLTLGHPAWLEPDTTSQREPTVENLERVLIGASRMVEAAIDRTTEAPTSAAAIPLPTPPFEYTRISPTRFTVSIRTQTKVVSLDVDATPGHPATRHMRAEGSNR